MKASEIIAALVDDSEGKARGTKRVQSSREEYLTKIVRRTAHDASLALGWSG